MLFWIAIVLFVPALLNAISSILTDRKKRKRASKRWKQLKERENTSS